MASAGAPAYWCHQCNRTVRPISASEIICPDCNGGFVEEVEASAAELPASLGAGFPPWNFTDLGGGVSGGGGVEGQGGFQAWQGLGQRPRGAPGSNPALAQFFEAMNSFFQHMQTRGPGLDPQAEGGGRIRIGTEAGAVNPMLVFQGQMPNIPGWGNIEFFVDNGTGAGPRRLPGNIGDYFLGPGLDQLIQQLAENDPNRYGAPPASKSAVEAMPTISIAKDHLGTDAAQCAVCKDEFEIGTEVRQMPCKHMYHADCILPWLAQHNSCPVCRFEMPTDDPDYDQARTRAQGSTGIAGNLDLEGMQGGGEQAAGTGGYTFVRSPRQFTLRFHGGGEGRNDAAGQEGRSIPPTSAGTSGTPQGGNTGASSGGGGGLGRRFSFFPSLVRTSTTTSQSPANAQAESSSQANSAETVSSGPIGEGNDTPGQTSRAHRTDDDGDTLMSEARQEDLD